MKNKFTTLSKIDTSITSITLNDSSFLKTKGI